MTVKQVPQMWDFVLSCRQIESLKHDHCVHLIKRLCLIISAFIKTPVEYHQRQQVYLDSYLSSDVYKKPLTVCADEESKTGEMIS